MSRGLTKDDENGIILRQAQDESRDFRMNCQPITIHSWPRAIMHMDADAFFASCEQAIHPELKGRPVITGKERGIVAAASNYTPLLSCYNRSSFKLRMYCLLT